MQVVDRRKVVGVSKAAVFTGYTGSVTVVTGVNFVAQTVTTKVVTYSNGIVTSIV